ncbi:MAG: hypothetical protein JXR68_02550 [Bacteroidales bacterium]|nr:hypothetical protein [Bacteroidales bacterium]
MKYKFLKTTIFIFFLLISSFVDAQQNTANSINLGFNIESFASLDVEFQNNKCKISNKFKPFIKTKLPVLLFIKKKSVSAFELQLGSDFNLLNKNKFLINNRVYFSTAYQNQILGKFVPFDFYFDLMPAYKFNDNAFLGFKFSIKQNIFTHIKNSDYVIERFNEITDENGKILNNIPKDGFYSFTSTIIQTGLSGKFKIRKKTDFSFDLLFVNRPFSIIAPMEGTKYGFIPFYLNLKFYFYLDSVS